MSLQKKIIDYCIANRVSTTQVADALGKNGVLHGVKAINYNHFRVGPVRVVIAANNSNYSVHERIREVNKGDVVVIFTSNCDGRAVIGDLVSKYLLLYRGAAAIVVQGMVRDAAQLRRQGYAIWAEDFTPLGCFNSPSELPYPKEEEEKLRNIYEDGVAICDDGGVTIIPRDHLTNDMLNRLQRIEMQEDIWFFCLDTLKWDTKKIVCDKAYLYERDFLSSIHVDRLSELSLPLDKKSD